MELDHEHVAADGKRYLLVHGDQFDKVTRHHAWVALLGTWAYDVLVELNMWLSRLRRTLRVPGYWSLAGYAKRRMKSAASFVSSFEESLLRHARARSTARSAATSVPALRERDGVAYINCGDWVDSAPGWWSTSTVAWSRVLDRAYGPRPSGPQASLWPASPSLWPASPRLWHAR